jgi:2-polyprenyl-3-methyl-5-hydroxy-6-metoxy-1,4-benzoquinol methylase
MRQVISRILHSFRWRFGKGWSHHDFQGRYLKKSSDAWGYLNDIRHQQRRERILSRLPNLSGKKVLEIGCAEGFITERLIAQANTVIACDLSEIAVARAKSYCQDASNATFLAADIRSEIPGNNFDICVASDVLYYLSENENRSLAKRLSDHMTSDGMLLFANEWNQGYRNLTHPNQTIAIFESTGKWKAGEVDTQREEEHSMHVVAILHRR